MARGKGGNRNQARDARGRFASSGTPKASRAKPKTTGGTAAAQSSLKRSRAKLTENPTPAQKGAVTRAKNKISAARKANTSRQKLGGAPKQGVIKNRGRKPSKLPTPANNIRRYQPATFDGKFGQIDRRIDSTMKGVVAGMQNMRDRAKKAKPRLDRMDREQERSNARSIADRGKKGIDGEIARIELGTIGSGPGAKAIRRRAARASAAAARGSKPARRAQEIYANQLAFTGSGKPKASKNNLRPGPRNTSGPPKRTRKPRKPRK